MTALAEALVAAQRRAIAALERRAVFALSNWRFARRHLLRVIAFRNGTFAIGFRWRKVAWEAA